MVDVQVFVVLQVCTLRVMPPCVCPTWPDDPEHGYRMLSKCLLYVSWGWKMISSILGYVCMFSLLPVLLVWCYIWKEWRVYTSLCMTWVWWYKHLPSLDDTGLVFNAVAISKTCTEANHIYHELTDYLMFYNDNLKNEIRWGSLVY